MATLSSWSFITHSPGTRHAAVRCRADIERDAAPLNNPVWVVSPLPCRGVVVAVKAPWHE